MEYYAGIDVSVEASSVCVLDACGKVLREGKVLSDPDALVDWLSGLGVELGLVGLEAGPLSQWLYAGLKSAGIAAELLETRHVRNAFKTMAVKTDRRDARGIAELLRVGWYRPVHCKSLSSQETRALLTARRQLKDKLHDLEASVRGLLRNFGLKVGKTTPRRFEARVRDLVEGHRILEGVAEALLRARSALETEFALLERQVRALARQRADARLLMTTPGVGPIVALDFVSAIDDPSRFASSKRVGAYFGLTQRKYQSGERDITGHISRLGDAQVRASLHEAAHVILTRTKTDFGLKQWAQRVAGRAGARRAKVALARRLAVVLHRMLADNTAFDLHRGMTAAA